MVNPEPQPAPQQNQQLVSISPPAAFDFSKPESWPKWEKRFLRFLSVANLSWKSSKEKTDLLCYTMGEQSEEILLRILPNSEKKSFEEVLKAFKDHFTPTMNVIAQRVKFNTRIQLPDEDVDSFITALYSFAETCNFSEQKEDLIRDRIVIGIRDVKTSKRLQSNSDLTLATAMAEVRQAELQAKELNRPNIPNKKKSSSSNKIQKSNEQNCCLCGSSKHPQGMLCPARNSRCKKCNEHGHFDKACKAKTVHNVTEKASSTDRREGDMRRMDSNSHSSDIENIGLWAVTEGSKRFSHSFFKVLVNSHSGNLIASPLSAQILLAMAAYGAGGDTATQMVTALQLPRESPLGRNGFRTLIKTVNAEKEVELRIATKIFFARHIVVNPSYQQLTNEKFFSSVENIDFSDSRAAEKTMNTWCNKQTNGRIPKLVEPGSLASDTVFLLANVLYFKGQWKYPFKGYETEHRPFYIDPKTTKLLPIMSNMDRFRFGELPKLDARFIEMPYKGERLSMIIILPNSITGLKKVQANLYLVNLKQSLQEVEYRYVALSVPKFKIMCDLNLGPILEELGMTRMFRASADFSGITHVPLNITGAYQTAFIEVNETGTEAFVRMVLKGGGGGPEHSFTVDRPFYFSIYHNPTGVSLFTGIVQVPKWD